MKQAIRRNVLALEASQRPARGAAAPGRHHLHGRAPVAARGLGRSREPARGDLAGGARRRDARVSAGAARRPRDARAPRRHLPLKLKRGGATLGACEVPAEIGCAAVVRLGLFAGLDPLLDGGTLEGRANVAKVTVRSGSDTAEILVSLWAESRGLDAELRVLSVNGRAVTPVPEGQLKRCAQCKTYQSARHRACEIDGSRLSDVEEDPTPGGVIGAYLVGEPLGEGGVGTVFAGEHALIGRPVAIKVLRASAENNPLLARRFLVEARVACRVRHPNLVEVTDFGLLRDGHPFIVMERIVGESLRARLTRTGPLESARRAARRARGGVRARRGARRRHRPQRRQAHQRDPPRRLERRGAASQAHRLRRRLAARRHRPRSGLIMGTLKYIAPERLLSKPADGRGNLYSLGVVLYELLSGCVPSR